MFFAKEFTIQRKKLGLSAEDIAKGVGVSRSYITLIETGKRLPGKPLLSKIAKTLRVEGQTVIDWYLVTMKERLSKGR